MSRQKIRLDRLDLKDTEHISFLYLTRTRPEVDEYLSSRPPENFLDHVEYLFNKKMEKIFFLAVWEDIQRHVGYAQITNDPMGDIEVGWVVHPDYWNMGFGTAMVSETLRMIYEWFPKDRKICLVVKKDNQVAIKLYQKFGFTFIGGLSASNKYLMVRGNELMVRGN